MSAKFEFDVFLSCDTMHARVVYSIVVHPSVWCECSVPAAERLDLSSVGIAQLAHSVGESILCHERLWCGSSQMTLGRTLYYYYCTHISLAFLFIIGRLSKAVASIWQCLLHV